MCAFSAEASVAGSGAPNARKTKPAINVLSTTPGASTSRSTRLGSPIMALPTWLSSAPATGIASSAAKGGVDDDGAAMWKCLGKGNAPAVFDNNWWRTCLPKGRRRQRRLCGHGRHNGKSSQRFRTYIHDLFRLHFTAVSQRTGGPTAVLLSVDEPHIELWSQNGYGCAYDYDYSNK